MKDLAKQVLLMFLNNNNDIQTSNIDISFICII